MKKNIKNATFLSLLALMGCTHHKNVVQNATMTRALLKDAKTGQERIYECPNNDDMKRVLIWLDNGATVDIVSRDYDNTLILTPENCRFLYDKEQVNRYMQELELAKKKAEMNYMEISK